MRQQHGFSLTLLWPPFRRPLWILSLVSCLAFVFSGCSMLFGVQALDEKLYRIPDIKLSPDITYKHQAGVRLSVRPTSSSQLINSQRILFSSDGIEQGFYQFANWAEPPPKRFTSLLAQAFEASKIFEAVSLVSSSAAAEYQLVTELIECIHDTSSTPGEAKVRVRVEMINLASRELIGQRTFSKQVAVKSYDARGAVDAISEAMNGILEEILQWSSTLAL